MQEDKEKEVYKSKITWLGKEVKDADEDDIEDEDKEEEEVEEIMAYSSDDDVAERRLLEIGLPTEEAEEEEESKGPFKRKTSGQNTERFVISNFIDHQEDMIVGCSLRM